MSIASVKRLYHQVPIVSIREINKRMGYNVEEDCLTFGFCTPEFLCQRKKFISYCLEGTHMLRCKYCGIVLLDEPDLEQGNISGFCPECFGKYKPRLYDKKMSWGNNMLKEGWKPRKKGWYHKTRGVFLPKRYQAFFENHKVTP